MTAAQLRRMFLQERRRFARRYPAVGLAGLGLADKPRSASRRASAYADLDGPVVVVYRSALRLPAANLRGLLRHEFGHVAAPRRGERGADAVAFEVTGSPIRYDHRGIQTTGRGVTPRPRKYHR